MTPTPDQITTLLEAARLYPRWIVNISLHPSYGDVAEASEALLTAVDAIDGKEGPT